MASETPVPPSLVKFIRALWLLAPSSKPRVFVKCWWRSAALNWFRGDEKQNCDTANNNQPSPAHVLIYRPGHPYSWDKIWMLVAGGSSLVNKTENCCLNSFAPPCAFFVAAVHIFGKSMTYDWKYGLARGWLQGEMGRVVVSQWAVY